MPDLLDRLTAALADRYAIERELGAGGMATVSNEVRDGKTNHFSRDQMRCARIVEHDGKLRSPRVLGEKDLYVPEIAETHALRGLDLYWQQS